MTRVISYVVLPEFECSESRYSYQPVWDMQLSFSDIRYVNACEPEEDSLLHPPGLTWWIKQVGDQDNIPADQRERRIRILGVI